MIERYQSSEIARIFSDKNRLGLFIEIEACLLETLAEKWGIPAEEITKLRALKTRVNPEAVARLEEKTRHDITAFLAWVWLEIPSAKGVGRCLHLGLTSSDLVDTALALQMKEALSLVLEALDKNIKELKSLAQKYQGFPIMGRTHGIHAEITSLGLKFLGFLAEARRHKMRLEAAVLEISYGKLSGSVGNFASSVITPDQEEKILANLGLKAEPVSTQVIPRDRHGVVMARLALTGGWIERIALEIRHLQRTEVAELAEPFAEGSQQGSSSMPHKRNPVLCENLCGLARLLRGYALVALENTALWHERDISHSSAERVAVPDAFHILHFGLKRLHQVLKGLVVNKKRIEQNLTLLSDFPASQKYLGTLIASGTPRVQAYKIIQQASFNAARHGSSIFEELQKVRELKGAKIKEVRHRDFLDFEKALFKRALQTPPL